MKTTESLTKPKIIAVLALACCLLWGSATPSIKIGYKLFQLSSSDTMSIILFAGCRFFFAGIITLILGSILNHRLLLPKKENLGIVTVQAFVQTSIQYFFYYIGLAHTVGAKGSIISGANCFFSVLIAGLIFRMEKVTPRKILGCVIGFAGIFILNVTNSFELSFRLPGEGALIISVIMYALSSVLLKVFSSREDPVTLCGWQFVLGGLIMIVIAFCCGGRLASSSARAWLILVYLALVASLAYTIWGVLLKYNDVSKVTVFSLSIPVFGVILSLLILDEGINPVQYFIALALVCFGIFLVNKAPKQKSL